MLDKIHQAVSEELGIPVKTIKEIHRFKTRWIREKMQTGDYVKIIDTNFGNYKISNSLVAKRLKQLKRRQQPGPVTLQQIDKYKSLIKKNMEMRYSRKGKLGIFRTENTIYG